MLRQALPNLRHAAFAQSKDHVQLGDNVLIIGLGAIGLIMGQIAKHYGADVVGCDIIEERLELAKDAGFDSIIRYTDLEAASLEYKLKTDHIGADKVFLTSGSMSSLPLAIASVREDEQFLYFQA